MPDNTTSFTLVPSPPPVVELVKTHDGWILVVDGQRLNGVVSCDVRQHLEPVERFLDDMILVSYDHLSYMEVQVVFRVFSLNIEDWTLENHTG